MEQKQLSEKQKSENWHDPDTLFCHAHFTKGTCSKIQNKEECKFKHQLFQSKSAQAVPQGICPNGVKCPMNHQKIKCPIELKDGKCDRKTVIGKKTFKCEYKHKKPESQKNQKKVEKVEKIQEKLEVIEQKKVIEKKIEVEKTGNIQKIEEEEKKEEVRQQQKKDVKKQFKVFKIPRFSEGADSTICGVLDQSGSMSSHFPYLARNWNRVMDKFGDRCKTVIFHCNARQEHKHLLERPDWGSTNIESGFVKLNEILQSQQTSDCITVIFVSDGGDNDTSTIEKRMEKLRDQVLKIQTTKKINFLCLGVGRGFPTFLAMKIRSLYHQGEQTVPPVFLVETLQDFDAQFQVLEQFLKHNQEVSVDQAVRTLPWSIPTQRTYENTFVLVDQDVSEIQVQNQKIQEYNNFSLGDIVELGRTFLNDVQLRSLQKGQDQALLKKQAKQAYDMIVELKDTHLNDKNKKLTFKQKVELRYNQEVLVNIIRQLKELSTTNVLSTLSESEAAKRLAIGTTQGKYHEQAIKLAGLSVEEFKVARDDFVKVLEKKLKNKELKEDNVGEQPQSFMSLQNQKEVFLEEGFVDGLKMIQNQYDLVETFPLVGQALKIRRTDGSMINPYLVSVQNILRLHNVVDTVSIQQAGGNEIEVSKGDGEQEVMNAVIPLFTKQDQDIDFFLRSKLFSILMTFNVCQNADTCLDQAYFALLCNVVVNLLNQKPSQWKEDMLETVFQTIFMSYSKNTTFVEYQKMLIKEPELAMITEISEKMAIKMGKPGLKDLKCEDLSKPITHLLYLMKFEKNSVSDEQLERIFNAVMQEVIGRFIPRDKPLIQQLEFSNKEGIEQQLNQEKYAQKILEGEESFKLEDLNKNFYTKQELSNKIEKKIMQTEIKIPEFNIVIPEKFMRQGKLNMMSLKNVFRYLFENKKKLKWQDTLTQVFFGYFYSNSADRYLQREKKFTFEKANNLLQEGTLKLIIQNTRESIKKQIEAILLPKYEELVFNCHDFCVPPQLAELQKIEGIKINNTSLLPLNACIHKDCPWYLKINNSLAQHLQDTIRIPALHKACQINAQNQNEVTNETIYQQIVDATYLDQSITSKLKIQLITEKALKHFLENKELYVARIDSLRKIYAEQIEIE